MIETANPDSMLITSTSPHVHEGTSVRRLMFDVIISLLPSLAASLVFFKFRSLLLVAMCVGFAVGTEWLCRKAMKRNNSIGDLSAVVTGLLLALTLPPGLPLWQAILGSVFAIAIAKQIYGGIGYNPFNPALVGRAFMLISFTAAMTTWSPSDWIGKPGDETANAHEAVTSATIRKYQKLDVDATTTATPLGLVKDSCRFGEPANAAFNYTNEVRRNLLIGNVNGSIGETSAIAILLGLAWLLIRRTITWHATVGYMGTMALFAWILQLAGSKLAMPVDFHLLSGGALFGAVFMATDLVTSPVSKWGRFIFGIGCGFITMIIRVVPGGAYPEGGTFAILIMNAVTPLINRAMRYRRFGAVRKTQQEKVA
jgi:electron transport complex protein RnfD